MAWNTPKTDWSPADGVMAGDLNRIECNINAQMYDVVTTGNTCDVAWASGGQTPITAVNIMMGCVFIPTAGRNRIMLASWSGASMDGAVSWGTVGNTINRGFIYALPNADSLLSIYLDKPQQTTGIGFGYRYINGQLPPVNGGTIVDVLRGQKNVHIVDLNGADKVAIGYGWRTSGAPVANIRDILSMIITLRVE